jgi:altronate hydrolase
MTVEQCGQEILDLMIMTASGDSVPKAVQLGQDDFLPWKRGVSL